MFSKTRTVHSTFKFLKYQTSKNMRLLSESFAKEGMNGKQTFYLYWRGQKDACFYLCKITSLWNEWNTS